MSKCGFVKNACITAGNARLDSRDGARNGYAEPTRSCSFTGVEITDRPIRLGRTSRDSLSTATTYATVDTMVMAARDHDDIVESTSSASRDSTAAYTDDKRIV